MIGPPSSNVGSRCIAYERMFETWQLINHLMSGTQAMRRARDRYMPLNPSESPQSFERRLHRSFLYEGFNLAVDTLLGKPFSQDVQLSKDLAEGPLSDWLSNIDKMGSDITTFARQVAEVGLTKGLVHVLVDYSNTSQTPNYTIAQKKVLNIRPFALVIDPEHVIGWRYDLEGNVPVLSQVRIEEKVCVPVGQWSEIETRQVRVFERIVVDGKAVVSYAVHRLMAPAANAVRVVQSAIKENWQIIEQGYVSTDTIPLVTIYFGKRLGFFEAHAPLKGVAYLNLEHWQSSSEQRNILNVARCPMWFFSGYDEGSDAKGEGGNAKVTMTPDSIVTASLPEAKLTIVEHSGKAIGAGRQDLLDIEARMAHSSVDLLTKKNSASSATQSAHDNSGEDCKLSGMIRREEDGLTEVFRLMYEYEKETFPAVTGTKLVTINTKFGLEAQDAADLQALYNSRVAGLISQETFLKELQRRGVLASNVNIKDEIAAAKADGPVLAPTKTDPTTGIGAQESQGGSGGSPSPTPIAAKAGAGA